MIKNQAGQKFYAILLGPSGPLSGEAANVSCRVQVDYGTERNLTGDPAAEDLGNGLYAWPLDIADTNGHELRFEPTHTNPNYHFVGQPSLVIYTRELSVNVGKVAGQDVTATQEVNFDNLDRIILMAAVLCQKVVPSDNGDGSYTLVFRNQTDTADVLSLRYNPQTGERTVV